MTGKAADHRVIDLEETLSLETIAPDGRIGVVALATDFCLEQDIRRMLPETVEVFTNRVHYVNPMTRDNLAAMAGDISRAARDILPGVGVDVLLYGCTSGTAVIGFDRIRSLLQEANPTAPVTTPITAVTAALAAVGARRISVLTPYDREINNDLLGTLESSGLEVISLAGLGFGNDLDVTRVSPADIVRLGVQYCSPDADALFISCTAFRASLAIEALEQKLGKPVVTSNQALAWHSLQLLSCDKRIGGYGRLFEKRL